MNWKEFYYKTIKNICEREIDSEKTIYEPEPPKAFFEGIMFVDETAPKNSFISLRLVESLAKEQDYKDYCEWVFQKAGLDIDDCLDKGFKNFKK